MSKSKDEPSIKKTLGTPMYTMAKVAVLASSPVLLGGYAVCKFGPKVAKKVGPKILKAATSQKAMGAYKACGKKVLSVSASVAKGLGRFTYKTAALGWSTGKRVYNYAKNRNVSKGAQLRTAIEPYMPQSDVELQDSVEMDTNIDYNNSSDYSGYDSYDYNSYNNSYGNNSYDNGYNGDSYDGFDSFDSNDTYEPQENVQTYSKTEAIDILTRANAEGKMPPDHPNADIMPALMGYTIDASLPSYYVAYPEEREVATTTHKLLSQEQADMSEDTVESISTGQDSIQPFKVENAIENEAVAQELTDINAYDWEAEYNNVSAEIERAYANHVPLENNNDANMDSNIQNLDDINIGTDMVAKFSRDSAGQILRSYVVNGSECRAEPISMEDYISFKTQANQISADRLEMEQHQIHQNLDADTLDLEQDEPELEFGNKDSLF